MIKARNNSYKNDRQARTKNSSSREETKKVEESKSSVVIRDEEDNHSDDDNIESDHSDHEVKPPVVSVSKTSSRQKQQVAEEYDEEEEEEELPPPKKQQRPVTSNSSRGSRKQIRQEVEEEEQPKHVSRKQPRQEVDEEAPRDARRGSPRRNALVSRPTLVRLIQQSKLESVSSDVYNFMIEEMTRYVNEVVDVLAEENDGDECVIKESYLKFLGDRSKAQGILDVKTFEKIYNTVSSKATVNIEFSSGAFNTFAKYTEHHMIDFLEKASTLISTYGRKRLNVSDLELLKSLLK